MKKICLFSCMSLFIIAGFAQSGNSQAEAFKNSIGFNASALLMNLFGNNGYYYIDYYSPYYAYPYNPGPYLVTFKHTGEKSEFRFGLGGSLQNFDSKPETGLTSASSSASYLYVRAGYAHITKLSERFSMVYGADLVNSSAANIYTSIYPDSTYNVDQNSKTISFGGGPMMGVSFAITKRFKISTEGALYYTYSKITSETNYENTPELNTAVKSTVNMITPVYPSVLYLEFAF